MLKYFRFIFLYIVCLDLTVRGNYGMRGNYQYHNDYNTESPHQMSYSVKARGGEWHIKCNQYWVPQRYSNKYKKSSNYQRGNKKGYTKSAGDSYEKQFPTNYEPAFNYKTSHVSDLILPAKVWQTPLLPISSNDYGTEKSYQSNTDKPIVNGQYKNYQQVQTYQGNTNEADGYKEHSDYSEANSAYETSTGENKPTYQAEEYDTQQKSYEDEEQKPTPEYSEHPTHDEAPLNENSHEAYTDKDYGSHYTKEESSYESTENKYPAPDYQKSKDYSDEEYPHKSPPGSEEYRNKKAYDSEQHSYDDKYKSDENDGQRVSDENDYSREIAKNHVNVGEKENDVPIPPQAKNKEYQHKNPNMISTDGNEQHESEQPSISEQSIPSVESINTSQSVNLTVTVQEPGPPSIAPSTPDQEIVVNVEQKQQLEEQQTGGESVKQEQKVEVKIEPAPLTPLEAPGGGCASARQPTAQCSPFGVCNETGAVHMCWPEGQQNVFDSATQSCIDITAIAECQLKTFCDKLRKADAGAGGKWHPVGGKCTKVAYFCSGNEKEDDSIKVCNVHKRGRPLDPSDEPVVDLDDPSSCIPAKTIAECVRALNARTDQSSNLH